MSINRAWIGEMQRQVLPKCKREGAALSVDLSGAWQVADRFMADDIAGLDAEET